MAKAKAKPQDGITFNTSTVEFNCGLMEIGNFEVQEGYYETNDGEQYCTRKEAENASVDEAKEYPWRNDKWTAQDTAKAKANVSVVDGRDTSHDIPFNATFATTNSNDQEDVEAKLPKLGFKVVAAWKSGSRETIKLWFKKPDGQKTVRV